MPRDAQTVPAPLSRRCSRWLLAWPRYRKTTGRGAPLIWSFGLPGGCASSRRDHDLGILRNTGGCASSQLDHRLKTFIHFAAVINTFQTSYAHMACALAKNVAWCSKYCGERPEHRCMQREEKSQRRCIVVVESPLNEDFCHSLATRAKRFRSPEPRFHHVQDTWREPSGWT